jgi:hypothetical protein
MADPIPTWLLMGWDIEALPGGIVHCRLKIAHSIEDAEQENFRLVPLGIPADHARQLPHALTEKAAQSLTRETPAKQ